MTCPKCSTRMVFIEKYTASGRDLRTYFCKRCNKYFDVDNGIALWKIMSNVNKEK